MFGFPKADRSEIKNYNRNFLKSVVFQLVFEENEEVLNRRKEIGFIFKESLPRVQKLDPEFHLTINQERKPVLQPLNDQGAGFELKSNDGQRILSFTNCSITLTVLGTSYGNFDNIIEVLNGDLKSVFEICKINSFKRVAIRKLNLIDFEIVEEDKVNPLLVSSFILNSDLMNSVSSFPDQSYVIQNINTLSYLKDEDKLNLRYGMMFPDPKNNVGQVLIDIELFNFGSTSLNLLESLSIQLNDEIFNIFNWSLSKESKRFLKQ